MIHHLDNGSIVVELGNRDVFFAAGVSYGQKGINGGHITFSKKRVPHTKKSPTLDGSMVPVRLSFTSLQAIEAFIGDLEKLRDGWEWREQEDKEEQK
jgi:hypothetical protein